MPDYRQTLNLPKTDFPMRGNLPNREPEMQKWWDEIDIYQQVLEKRKGADPLFCMTALLMPTGICTLGML